MTDHRAAMAKAARDAAKAAAQTYRNANPDAAGLSLKADIAAFRRRPREFKDFHRRAVALLLSERQTVELSNARLAARLSEGMPFRAPSNVFTEKLRSSQCRELQELLAMKGIELDLTRYNSLSKIKKALKGHYSGKEAEDAVTISVAFTANAVVIDGRKHPIQQTGKYRRIHAGRAMVNVDGLRVLLLPE